jgi:hypothetical protein
VHTYTKADGNHLSVSTTGNYVSAVMNAAARKFGDDAVVDDAGTTTKEFFAVLGGRGSTLAPQNNWYMQMLAGMRHAGTQREIEAGNELAADTPGLSRDAVVAIAKAYFSTNKKKSTKEAMWRRFVVVLLWSAVGRVAECVFLSYNLVNWCFVTGLAYFKWSQAKTGKQKPIILVPARDGYVACPYHAWASALALGWCQNAAPDGDGVHWAVPEFRDMQNSSVHGKVGTMLTDCLEGNGTGLYGDIKLDCMDPRTSGVSIRHGAINTCLYKGCTYEQTAQASGHELADHSALGEYVHITPLMTMAAAKVLSGWAVGKFMPTRSHRASTGEVASRGAHDA